jgi:signal peptidase II
MILSLIIIILDQYTKVIANNSLSKIDTFPLIENVFHFTLVKNRGAAFGILQNQRWFFITITIAIVIAMMIYLLKYKPKHKLLLTSLSMIIGGAIGNLIDRIKLGYVIDFFDFRLINFAVFNVADSFVVVGTILLSYYLLFIYKEPKEEENDQ